jgi:hypothetical protein
MVLRPNGTRIRPVEIRVDGVRLKEVKVFKYLGFLVTPDLSFTAHITHATERARADSTAIPWKTQRKTNKPWYSQFLRRDTSYRHPYCVWNVFAAPVYFP